MHEISFNSLGDPEAVFAGKPAWHGLGELVPNHLTPTQALAQAHLTWDVLKVPIHFRRKGAAGFEEITTHRATVRGDDSRLLGVVGEQYRVIQNRELAGLVEALAGEGAAVVECCGALRGGRRIFFTLRIPRQLRVGRDDRIQPYLVLASSHDGSLALRLLLTSVRVVCQNTLSLALKGASASVVVRHVGDVRSRIEEARRVLGLSTRHFGQLEEHLDELASVAIDDEQARTYFREVVPLPEKPSDLQRRRVAAVRAQLLDNFRSGAGHELAGATLHGAFQAVAEHASHQRRLRGRTLVQQAERRFEGLLLGGPAQVLEQRAFESACRLLEAA